MRTDLSKHAWRFFLHNVETGLVGMQPQVRGGEARRGADYVTGMVAEDGSFGCCHEVR